IRKVSASSLHTCALQNNGDVKCWGINEYGQLGDGTKIARTTPVKVSLSGRVREVTTGTAHSCALMEDIAEVKCWGIGSSNILGYTRADDSPNPTDVGGLDKTVISISAGYDFTCALLRDGSVKCWGGNLNGQLGIGTKGGSAPPTNVVGLSSKVIALDSGFQHVCAILDNGKVMCWGNGYLGNGVNSQSSTPVEVLFN
ncbi:RCC1 repeat-containing protein, partial [Candidatus Woesebacteria bacterium]|nr:RCC1 repeat-containing protein [Candidatus Woesebacteria bacterium]